jgi:hypothetical protein
MSSTALDVRKTVRVMPLRENPAVRKLREGTATADPSEALSDVDAKAWAVHTGRDWGAALRKLWLSRNPLYGPSRKVPPPIGAITALRVFRILLGMIFGQTAGEIKRILASRRAAAAVAAKTRPGTEVVKPKHGLLKRLKRIAIMVQNLKTFMSCNWEHDRFMAGECREALDKLRAEGVDEVAVFGAGGVADMLCVLSGEAGIRISGVYADAEALARAGGRAMVASFVNIEALRETLRQAGVKEEDIIYFK